MNFDIDQAKNYATEANLLKALSYWFASDVKYLVVCNRAGRFTAIFPTAWNPAINAGHIAHAGFMVVG